MTDQEVKNLENAFKELLEEQRIERTDMGLRMGKLEHIVSQTMGEWQTKMEEFERRIDILTNGGSTNFLVEDV